MKAIYKMNIDCGRMGSLEGAFVSDINDMEKLINSGKEIDFGEVLGKHSEVVVSINKKDITLVTDDFNVVELFEKYDLSSGYNPFDYLDDDDLED